MKFFCRPAGLIACVSVLAGACGAPPDKYRDIKHLELPPTLAVEHKNIGQTQAEPAEKEAADAGGLGPNSDLQRLIYLGGDKDKPELLLKTGFERSWDLVERGLNRMGLDIIEKNREKGVYRVRYIPEESVKSSGLFADINSYLSGKGEEEYTLTVDKEQKITGVHVKKTESGAEDKNDFSANLIKALRQSIIVALSR